MYEINHHRVQHDSWLSYTYFIKKKLSTYLYYCTYTILYYIDTHSYHRHSRQKTNQQNFGKHICIEVFYFTQTAYNIQIKLLINES